MDIGVIYTGIPEQYNIWLYFITYYRKISRYNFSKNKTKQNIKGFCLKRRISNQRLLDELTPGRAAMSFWWRQLWITSNWYFCHGSLFGQFLLILCGRCIKEVITVELLRQVVGCRVYTLKTTCVYCVHHSQRYQ